jgi:ketosteroid isomerase-like protein
VSSGDTALRLDRLESVEAVRRLCVDYANAVDMRDVDRLATLFCDHARTLDGRRGHTAFVDHFGRILGGRFRTTIHWMGNHAIDVDPEHQDRASGTLYCRAEHELGDRWIVLAMRYDDRYERAEGVWRFHARRARAWYAADVLERPAPSADLTGVLDDVGLFGAAELPCSWPTWSTFWDGREGGAA